MSPKIVDSMNISGIMYISGYYVFCAAGEYLQVKYNFKIVNSLGEEAIVQEAFEVLAGVSGVPNQAPILNPIGDKTVNENEIINFTISGFDPDNDPIFYEVSNLPYGAVFNPTTQTFNWKPAYNQAETYKIFFDVYDGELSDTEEITITVSNVNQLPNVVLSVNPNSGNAPLSVNFVADAGDSDGNIISYEWDLDGNGSYDSTTVNNIISHTYNSPAKYNPKVRVTDNDDATAEATAVVNVTTQIVGNIDVLSPGSANRVDGHDLYIFSLAFGSQPEDSNWNISADLDNNLIIDGNDLIILAGNFGKKN